MGKRGRGWKINEVPVEREPPFIPFFYHTVTPKLSIDDGRAPSIRMFLSDTWHSLSGKKSISLPKQEEPKDELIPYYCDEEITALVLSFPKEIKVSVEDMCRVLFLLSSDVSQLSFEIIGDEDKIHFQFVCRDCESKRVSRQLHAYFPFITVSEITGADVYDIIPVQSAAYAIDLGLQQEFICPLGMPKQMDADPYQGLFTVLEHFSHGEKGMVQILFSRTVNPWSESILRSVTDNEGGSFFMDAPEMTVFAKEKISYPLCAVNMRVIGVSDTNENAYAIAARMNHALTVSSMTRHNSLIPLSNGIEYPPEKFFEDIILRQSHREGMLLNVKELATFIHLPSPTLHTFKLIRETKRTKKVPDIALGHDCIIGVNTHMNASNLVTLSTEQRFKHTHIIGATGTGKSTLLLNLITQDIQNYKGVAVLDPHGDLIDQILEHIPEDRIGEVILLDPSDEEFPIGFNILSAHSDAEKTILASDLVSVFKRFSTSWGDQMNSVFANAILATLESKRSGSLIDLRKFLIEKEYRNEFLQSVADPNIIYYWQKEYPLLKSSSIGPILTRLDSFLRPKLIRNMVAQQKSLDFDSILSNQKILLVKVSQGLIGQENSFLFGSFVVSKIHQAALARQILTKNERKDFFFYIDEFQNFITPSMTELLSGARKYHLGLILAHQDMQQVIKQDQEVASAILANAGTRICFRLGEVEAKRFADGFSFFESSDIQNLQTGDAIIRIDRPHFDCNVSVIRQASEAIPYKKEIIQELSRKMYGTPKEEVEATLHKQFIKEDINTPQSKITRSEIEEIPIQEKILHQEKKNTIMADEKPPEDIRQHKYLQMLIKNMAESRGYIAVCEELTKDGKGRVDVALSKNNIRIACEICVTTTDAWEVHNITKCLNSGYSPVYVCSTEKKNLEKIQRLAKSTLPQLDYTQIFFYTPEELFFAMDQQVAKEKDSEERIKGYRVKVEYKAVSPHESEQKEQQILKSVTRIIKRKK